MGLEYGAVNHLPRQLQATTHPVLYDKKIQYGDTNVLLGDEISGQSSEFHFTPPDETPYHNGAKHDGPASHALPLPAQQTFKIILIVKGHPTLPSLSSLR